MTFRWAIVDIETTGLNVLHDKITEIAVTILTEEGIESTWHSLINPGISIPGMISRLTGITNSLVKDAPAFSDIANELIDVFSDCVLVAHNARFDYGFLKNAFREADLTFKLPVLCTIKLFKRLYPDLPRYSLKSLAQHFDVINPAAHRAQGDVATVHALLERAQHQYSQDEILEHAKRCYQQAAIPSKLTTDITTFPDSPGVYLFYGAQTDFPIYIGKSVTLRQRILSHFQSDHSNSKEFNIAQQVERIEIIPTAGELSALLLESQLVKEKMPLYNRRLRRKKSIVGFRLNATASYTTVELVRELSDADESHHLYGSYPSQTAAKDNLVEIVKEFKLCSKLCGLEQSKSACFGYQLKRCLGACVGKESIETYNARVLEAFSDLKKATWPFDGSIAIKEQCETNQLTQYLIFNQWRHVATVEHLNEVDNGMQANVTYDMEHYKILSSFLKNKVTAEQIVQLF